MGVVNLLVGWGRESRPIFSHLYFRLTAMSAVLYLIECKVLGWSGEGEILSGCSSNSSDCILK